MIRLDDKDHRLILALKRNARQTVDRLARDIGLSRTATHDRIARLEEAKVIQRYTTIVDHTQMDRKRAVFLLHFRPDAQTSLTARRIRQLPGVTETYCMAGDIDMFIRVECESDQKIMELRSDIARLNDVDRVDIRTILDGGIV